MAGPKAQIQAPIDRPLARAYLREFTGWSTAYPPGLSDPSSLRLMENVQINRDGSARVRPGLRYLSYAAAGVALSNQVVGSHEVFYLNDGRKAYLFAVREALGTVGFRVLVPSSVGGVVKTLTDAEFSVPQGETALAFSSKTTYVKYLQIDNKIFALSNAGEPMRLFYVGANKVAKALAAITRPEWSVADKLTVIHPDASWITSGTPSDVRQNLFPNPDFEQNRNYWDEGANTKAIRVTGGPDPVAGTKTLRLSSKPQRTNLCPMPLHAVGTYGITGWTETPDTSIGIAGSYLGISTSVPGNAFARGPEMVDVDPGTAYRVAFDVESPSGLPPKARFRFFGSSGTQIGDDIERIFSGTSGRVVSAPVTAPVGAVTARVLLGFENPGTAQRTIRVKSVVVSPDGESTAIFTGSSGTNYFWTGDVNASASVYHPPADISLSSSKVPISPSKNVCASLYVRGDVSRSTSLKLLTTDAAGATLGTVAPAAVNDSTSVWTRLVAAAAPAEATAVNAKATLTILAVPRGEYHYVDAALLEPGVTDAGAFFCGSTANVGSLVNEWAGDPHASASLQTTYAAAASIPEAETRTADTLISMTGADNQYHFGFFYTFSNEVGESAASQITVVRTQRGYSAWSWMRPNDAGEPGPNETSNPDVVSDQLVAYMPQDVFTEAMARGATSWNLYMFTWSDQDPVPVTAVKVAARELDASSEYAKAGWIRVTPAVSSTASEITVLPSKGNRYDYSNPSHGGQGLVAADRMVLVLDPTAAAVIRWSSNNQGDYTNFTANKGGGYKTLTSGNLYVPACVKLWQNPQSADTLTILCMGTDGHSTGYYMAPAQVASQSEATNIMGFEETTATPGTTSPYGCEVFNNSLYHPLDDQLMKSTASNYNINHKSQTDLIRNQWEKLATKEKIISAVHDNRLYYIVNNPEGEGLESGCNGNEVWVLDAGGEKGSWSRWKIQAHSLRKIEFGGRIYMSVIRPDGIFYLDPEYGLDDVVLSNGTVYQDPIPWKLETNTQGANRAHDAWAHLQQANIVVGNFQGAMRYGIRSLDIHGQPVEIAKVVRDTGAPGAQPFDLEDFLLIRRDLKEWFFFAESLPGELSFGQLSLVQYRYTPVTVNAGYEYGSVETFEYGRAAAGSDSITTNGTPLPMIDARRP